MSRVPKNPKIYHITHVDNLPQIVRDGVVWSDAERLERGLRCHLVGMSKIKQRRLKELRVKCHPETFVGEYVPFYFCPRSIMLYILHAGNHPEVTYRGGQEPIIHLQADLSTSTRWADQQRVRWAFSDRNAGTYVADFSCRLDELGVINWNAVAARDFRVMRIKEGKQAEFLVHRAFPWQLVEKVGVFGSAALSRVQACLAGADHKPLASIERGWYY